MKANTLDKGVKERDCSVIPFFFTSIEFITKSFHLYCKIISEILQKYIKKLVQKNLI